MYLEVYPQVLGVSTLKRCTKCGELKPKSPEFFYPASGYKDGLRSYCRACEKELNRKRNKTDKRQKVMPKAREGYKFCPRCERELPATLEYFYEDKARQSGFASSCKDCARLYSKEYRVENPEKHAQSKRNWRKANPDKVKAHKSASQKRNRASANERTRRFNERHPEKRLEAVHARRARVLGNGGKYTSIDIEAIRTAQGNRCYLCGKRLKTFHIDHFIPLALGGTNDAGNLRLACPACNLSKGAKHPHDMGRLI